jgi:hypothetical protein
MQVRTLSPTPLKGGFVVESLALNVQWATPVSTSGRIVRMHKGCAKRLTHRRDLGHQICRDHHQSRILRDIRSGSTVPLEPPGYTGGVCRYRNHTGDILVSRLRK